MMGQSPGARPITLHGNRPIARREADAGVSEHVYGYSAPQITGCLEISNHTHEVRSFGGFCLARLDLFLLSEIDLHLNSISLTSKHS